MRIPLFVICLLFCALRADVASAPDSGERPLITSPTVVYLIVDGMRLDTFVSAMSPSEGRVSDALSEVFGEGLSKSRVVIDNHAVFPSVTFASNASLVTGVTVTEHGIAGNRYLDRRSGTPVDLLSGRGMSDVFRRGLADKVLQRAPMYEAFPVSSLVSFHFFGKGAEWVRPESMDAVLYSKNPAAYDYLATGRLLGRLRFVGQRRSAAPRVVTLYWPGLDEWTHRKGVKIQADYVRGALNASFEALLDGLVGAGGGGLRELGGDLRPYTFVLTSDHGLCDVRRRISSGEIARAVEKALTLLPEYRGLTPKETASTFHVAANGGMAHLYLRMPNRPWSERLFDSSRGLEILETVGGALRDDPALTDKLDWVFVSREDRDAPWKCMQGGGLPNLKPSAAFENATRMHSENSFRYFGAEESLLGLGRAGGDIVLTADYDAGYGFIDSDTPKAGSPAIHGNLFAEDMRVPLVIAGGGVETGIFSAKGGNINPARIVADLAGFPLEGRPAPTLTPVKGASPMWLSAPARWAEVGGPYMATLAAVSPKGLPLTYNLRKGPPGMTLDRKFQALRWVPSPSAPNVSSVVVEAVDEEGRKSELKYAITVFPKAPAEP